MERDPRNQAEDYYYRKLHREGCKRLTLPLESPDHIENTINVLEQIIEQFQRISKQRIPQYLRLLHARMVIAEANGLLKRKANGHITKSHDYKGAT